MAANEYEVIPSAKRLMRSLRDMGYGFPAAVADLIDNSIEARASNVRVYADWEDDQAIVLIADNGVGMTPDQLREALRFGSERDYVDNDLGKFGLGLKTASLSQCLRLTVASRHNSTRADIAAYCWDMDHIDAKNRWEILGVRTTDLPAKARQHLKETTGTVVIWERLDRILGYHRPEGDAARKGLMAMCRDMEEHLAMVFHRFLAGEVRGKRLAIYLNDNKIMPWDPFARNEPNTQKFESFTFRVEGENGAGDVVVEPYALPAQSKFSSPDAWSRASGPRKWNRQQGFYIYRSDRMIQSGGWSNIRAVDEHLKLARIAISFGPKLDEEFKINVPKMRVSLPNAIRDEIAVGIQPATKLAQDAYRNGARTVAGPPGGKTVGAGGHSGGGAKGGGGASRNGSGTSAGGGVGASQGLAEEVRRVGMLLRKYAKPTELDVVKEVVNRAISALKD